MKCIFNDDSFIAHPFFEQKLDDYFKISVSLRTDSVISEVKYMLLSARTGKEIYPYSYQIHQQIHEP
jgi:hypothetical protein